MSIPSTIKLIRAALDEHTHYWDKLRPDMVRLNNMYTSQFWKTEPWDDSMIRIESPEGYAFIEGYVASLFSKAPAVSVSDDITGEGDADMTKEVVDRFLYDTHRECESATRQALIYTHAFLKLAPRDSDNILDMVALRALPPWEVILDRSSVRFEDQRFMGHVYYMPVSDARDRWGAKQFVGIPKEEFLCKDERKNSEIPKEFLYIQVVEFYNMLDDELYFWSPQYSNGDKLLETLPIPVRTHDDRPLPALAPLYFVRQPSVPLEGISSLERQYDPIKEKNIIRSFWANSVRADTRKYLYKEGAFDSEQLAKLTSGVEQAMIGVDEDNLSDLISPVPNTPISSNHDRYLARIDDDLSKGSVLAPFTRGEGTKGATATEIRAMYAYSSSEIGRLARERDAMIEKVSEIYTRMLVTLIEDENARITILVNGKPALLSVKKLDGKFKFQALDMASTPLAEDMKQQSFLALIPILQSVGISQNQIREQLVRLFGDILPSAWAEAEAEAEAEQLPEAPGAGPAALGAEQGLPPGASSQGAPVGPDGLPLIPKPGEL